MCAAPGRETTASTGGSVSTIAQICPNTTETLRVGGFLVERLIREMENWEIQGITWKNEFSVHTVTALKEWLPHALHILERHDQAEL